MSITELCDFILAWLDTKPQKTAVIKSTYREALLNEIGDNTLSEIDLMKALGQLTKQGFIADDIYPGQKHYRLTLDGEIFLTSGGYKGIRERQERADKGALLALQVSQSTLETNQSVVLVNASVLETNSSVKELNELTKNTHKFQIWATIMTIGVAVASVIIAILAYYKDDAKPEIKVVPVPNNIYYNLKNQTAPHAE